MAGADTKESGLDRVLSKLVAVRPAETPALLWSSAYFFVLLAAYYILRPVRDQMGIAGGVKSLPNLFTLTFIVILIAQPAYGALVARIARSKFIPIVYHFFVLNLAIFWTLLHYNIEVKLAAQAFFVWLSVFNIFAVAVFWSFMADLFESEQSKRLFGFIAAGGQAGAMAGPALAITLAKPLGPANLLILAAVLLEVAVFCTARLEKAVAVLAPKEPKKEMVHNPAKEQKQVVGGGWLEGFIAVAKSPYLTGNAIWMVLLSFTGTVIYLEQANLVSASGADASSQVQLFASLDLSVGVITLLLQWLITGRLMTKLGTALALALQPVVFALGFGLVAVSPILMAVLVVQVVQRVAGFAFSNPARQVLFTVGSRDDKYKAKNVIDTVVFRGSDAASAMIQSAFKSIEVVAITGLVLSVGWVALSFGLGKTEERKSKELQKAAALAGT
jgi:AAA family ATP:ADP antiporter